MRVVRGSTSRERRRGDAARNRAVKQRSQVSNKRGRQYTLFQRIFFLVNVVSILFVSFHLRNAVHTSQNESTLFKEISDEPKLPHWRIGTDCSPFRFDCLATALRENKYKPYPFSFLTRKEIEAHGISNTKHSDKWSIETINELPSQWVKDLEKSGTKERIPVTERNYLYPPKVPEDEFSKCMDLALNQNRTTMEQFDELFFGKSPKIFPEPDTNMVAYTISDYGYVEIMLHDVFQMMDSIVGFSNRNFFLLALDTKSVELACKHGYPVVFWKANDKSLKNAVANTKVVLSYELSKRKIDHFFSEMDVWWIRSPKPNLIDFQKRHEVDDGHQKHIYFSPHQNKPMYINIGMYAVKGDKYSEDYFRVCGDILQEKPQSFDQNVFNEVHSLFQATFQGRDYRLKPNRFRPKGPPTTPEIKFPFEALMFGPHQIAAEQRPMVTSMTLAIHTLCNAPLEGPHGKIMYAKELGAYYGFHSQPQGTLTATTDDNAGYYDRSGRNRRYLWLDTELQNNAYSLALEDQDQIALEWTMAIMMAIARRTNRILVLPQVFGPFDTHFAWTIMDYSKVTNMIDFRETNFASDPRAWRNRGVDPETWPFESVVNTALFRGIDNKTAATIYTQISNRSTITSTKVLKANNIMNQDWLDAWFGSMSSSPELDMAEVLLVNPDAFMTVDGSRFLSRRFKDWKEQKAVGKPGLMEQEVFEIYDLLGWCWNNLKLPDDREVTSHTNFASKTCFRRGKPRKY